LAGKVVIYGGAGGIGTATGRLLHARGYDLHLVGRNQDRLAGIAAELDAGYTVGDVRESELFSRVAQEAWESLDGLVFAVGTITLRSLQRLTEADFMDDFRVNGLGARVDSVKEASCRSYP
jgi:NADP-dependent 3-hydroxy acid dehydrogenase YdfG